MSGVRVLRCGERGALVELESLEHVLGLHAALQDEPPAGTVELVPAACTLLVAFDPARTTFDRLAEDIRGRPLRAVVVAAGGEPVEVPVRYDGEDLAEVARRTGMSEAGVVGRHREGAHVVAFSGFAPGFPYIAGLDEALRLPRRATPRTRVPAGAVAIADRFTGIYPRESPGGWWLIGRTDLTLWDIGADPPSRLQPGTPVRFVETGA